MTLIWFTYHEQDSFSRSNFSMAFPYVSASEEGKLENLLVSGFAEACGGDLGMGNVAFLGSCAVEKENHEDSATLRSIEVMKRIMCNDLLGNFVSCNGDLMLLIACYY